MTSIAHSSTPPAPNSTNNNNNNNSASQSARAGSPAVVGSNPPVAATPAHQPSRSYAHATKSSVSGPPPVAVGAPQQHGKQDSVNGRVPSSGNMATPAIVNSGGGGAPNGSLADHSRKPSVTISAQGASGQMPNGAPSVSAARPNINFGSMNAGGGAASPAVANSTPYQQQNSALATPQADPRITSPAASPSPIPQPAASGGRPPSALPNQGNGLNFGNMPGPDSNGNQQMQQPMMGGPNGHLRRASSQHSDMSGSGMPMGPGGNRGGYMGGPPRGRGGFNQQGYPQPMAYSPGPQYRQVSTPQRPGSGLPPHFQNQMGPQPGSPHNPPRSPGPMGSNPGTPHMQYMQMHPGQHMGVPSYGAYAQQMQGPPGQMGMQQPYDPNYGYYQQPYNMHPQYMQGTPHSPRHNNQFKPPAGTPHQQNMPGGMFPQPPSQSMSRTSSQVSERPASSLGSAQHPPAAPAASSTHGPSHGHSQSVSAAPSKTDFKIPSRQSKGIIIKNADGEVVTFDKKPSPAPSTIAQPPSPATVSSTATPPPRSSSAVSHSHTRSESNTAKSAAEIRAEFQAQVKSEMKEPLSEEGDATSAGAPKAKEDETAKAAKDKEEADAKAAKDKQETEAKAAYQKAEADAEAATAAKEKADADKAEADAQAAKEAEAEKSKSVESSGAAAETDEERKKREDDEEMERMIAEMEAQDKAEAEREAAYAAKKKEAAEKQKLQEKDEADHADERMRQAERDAEALEESRQSQKPQDEDSEEAKAEREKLFASLKKPDLGPRADSHASTEEAPGTPASEPETPIPAPRQGKAAGSSKPKPAALKLETAKSVEPAQPTPGMRSLRSARLLDLKRENADDLYPEGIQSPNPALQTGRRGGKLYDKDFLMQFQDAFQEKPTLDWESKLKETLGDPTDSAAPKSARTPGMTRGPSARGGAAPSSFPQAPMGNFTSGGRTLPPGTTSADRFRESNSARPTMQNPLARFGPPGGGSFPMQGGMGGRPPSMGSMPPGGHGSRDNRSKGGSKGPRQHPKESAAQNAKMPLTAGADLKPIEVTSSGWKPTSIGGRQPPTTDVSGHMPPDVVQRKVKSNLNKMAPEKFDKIANEILVIAAQSKDETDGRTLRQVIALTFEKACDEAHWASMYAKFAKRMLEEMTTEIKDENVTDKTGQPVVGGALFRKYLLNRCQEEFERGWEVNLPLNAEGQTEEAVMLSDEYYKAAAAKRKGLGLVQFIGELYKLGMLSIRIMHQCVTKLLDFEGDPDETSIESLIKLLRTVGGTMTSEKEGPKLIDAYFERIDRIMKTPNLPSRMHFMLLDTVDLRKSGWRSKDDARGPKTIQEIREEAAAAQQKADLERQRQNQRGGGGRMPSGRGDARNFSGSQMPPPDYSRNTVGTDDLRRLNQRKQDRQGSGPARTLGPSNMLASRSSSGRGLGPPGGLFNRGDSGPGSSPASSAHSRSASQAQKKEEEPKPSANAFSALAGMDGDGPEGSPSVSPQLTKSQPAVGGSSDANPSEEAKAGDA